MRRRKKILATLLAALMIVGAAVPFVALSNKEVKEVEAATTSTSVNLLDELDKKVKEDSVEPVVAEAEVVEPTSTPTPEPTATPTPEPTAEPTPEPTPEAVIEEVVIVEEVIVEEPVYDEPVEAEPASNDDTSSSGDMSYIGTYTCTFYCPCEEHCNGSLTASGEYAIPWGSVACEGLPFGTTIYIEDFGTFVVLDRGCGSGVIDIFVNHHSEIPSYGMIDKAVYICQ